MNTNKERLILTDCDGVLLSWSEKFEEWLKQKHSEYVRIPNSGTSYNLAHRFQRIVNGVATPVEFITMKHLVSEFNESPAIQYLGPWKDSVEGVAKLVAHNFRFVAITSLSEHPDSRERRLLNLHELFGDVFDDLICLEVGSSKQHILERWADSELFWLEDHFKNAEAGYEVGLRPILVDGETNQKYNTDLFPRTCNENPWRDICEMVFEEYGIAY